VSKKLKINKPRWLNHQLVMVFFVALFFSLSMTWVEMDPALDHQKNVDNLRIKMQNASNSELSIQSEISLEPIYETRNRQTDGIVFGSSMLVVIIIGGIVANIRTYQ